MDNDSPQATGKLAESKAQPSADGVDAAATQGCEPEQERSIEESPDSDGGTGAGTDRRSSSGSWTKQLVWIIVGVVVGDLLKPLDFVIDHFIARVTSPDTTVYASILTRPLSVQEGRFLNTLGVEQDSKTQMLVFLLYTASDRSRNNVVIAIRTTGNIVAHYLPSIPCLDESGREIEDPFLHFAHRSQFSIIISTLPSNTHLLLFFAVKDLHDSDGFDYNIAALADGDRIEAAAWPSTIDKTISFLHSSDPDE
jgi:hypothetical protein